MTQHNLNDNVIGVVEFNPEHHSYKLSFDGRRVNFKTKHLLQSWFDLPPGSWQILGRPKEISEEVWKGLVDIQEVGYYDYEDVYCVGYFNTALESGLSWCRANNIDEENFLLIIKNK